MGDLEFAQRCVKGDKSAWDEFVERYSRLVYNYIHSVLKLKGINSSDPQDLRDIYQEVFLSLTKDNFRKLKSFKGLNGCSLASWLRQVVINLTLDYLSRGKPAVSIDAENEDDFSLQDILAADSISPRDKISLEDKIGQLKDCIGQLERTEQYFLELYINRKLSLEEIKDVLRVNRSALDMRKARIIDKLRQCFKSKGFLLDF